MRKRRDPNVRILSPLSEKGETESLSDALMYALSFSLTFHSLSLSLLSVESGVFIRKTMLLMPGELRHGCAFRHGNVLLPHACISAYACYKYHDSCSSCNV